MARIIGETQGVPTVLRVSQPSSSALGLFSVQLRLTHKHLPQLHRHRRSWVLPNSSWISGRSSILVMCVNIGEFAHSWVLGLPRPQVNLKCHSLGVAHTFWVFLRQRLSLAPGACRLARLTGQWILGSFSPVLELETCTAMLSFLCSFWGSNSSVRVYSVLYWLCQLPCPSRNIYGEKVSIVTWYNLAANEALWSHTVNYCAVLLQQEKLV